MLSPIVCQETDGLVSREVRGKVEEREGPALPDSVGLPED